MIRPKQNILKDMNEEWIIVLLVGITSLVGIIYAWYNYIKVARIQMVKKKHPPRTGGRSSTTEEHELAERSFSEGDYSKLVRAGQDISSSATVYLLQEYSYLGGFILGFAVLIYLLAEVSLSSFWVTGAYLVGAISCMLADFFALRFAVISNVRTVKKARKDIEKAFQTARRAGVAIGFFIVSIGVLTLTLMIKMYMDCHLTANSTPKDHSDVFLFISGFALGASVVALFGKVGGGIFAKAADVGVELTSSVQPEGVDKNPGVVADFVGDNVGDIVGTGSDFFASFTEVVCATLILSCAAPALLNNPVVVYFPILIFTVGILVSFLTVIGSSTMAGGKSSDKIEQILHNQPLIAAILMTPLLYVLCAFCLPAEFQFLNEDFITTRNQAFTALLFGLWGGYFIGLASEYFTSREYSPVQEVAQSCESGSATDIIYGLALGYMSTIAPVIILIVVIYLGYVLSGFYGVAIAACGMLSTFTTALSINSYGPVADNASGLANMCNLHYAALNCDQLHAAGKVANAHAKSFSVGAAALIALSIFGAFITRHNILVVNLLQPIEFAGLVIGAMIPYVFSSQILESVSNSAGSVEKEILDQKTKSIILFEVSYPY